MCICAGLNSCGSKPSLRPKHQQNEGSSKNAVTVLFVLGLLVHRCLFFWLFGLLFYVLYGLVALVFRLLWVIGTV